MPRRVLSLVFLLLTVPLYGQTVVPVSDGTLSGNFLMSADNVYILDGPVFVTEGDTLRIEAGTVIGGKAVSTEGGHPASLVIAAGAVLLAEGTRDNPITLTSEREALGLPGDLRDTSSWWGGLYVLGRAPLDDEGGLSRTTAPIPGVAATDPRSQYGGDDEEADAGSQFYVSVRHVRGHGIQYLGVGRPSVFFRNSSYLEVYRCTGHGFYFEGTNNFYDHLVASEVGGSAFAFGDYAQTEGQFWLGIRSGNDYGQPVRPLLQADTDYRPLSGLPGTRPTLRNVTLLGARFRLGTEQDSATASQLALYGSSSILLANSLLVGGGVPVLALDSISPGVGSYYHFTNGIPDVQSTRVYSSLQRLPAEQLFTVRGAGQATTAVLGEETFLTDRNRVNFGPSIVGEATDDPTRFSPVLPPNSQLLNVAPGVSGNGFEAATYAGAFGTEDWTLGWTALAAPYAGLQQINGALVYDPETFACTSSTVTAPISGAFVQVEVGADTFHVSSDEEGAFFLRVPPGSATVTSLPPSRVWTNCAEPVTVQGDAGATSTLVLPLTGDQPCALPRVHLSSVGLRPDGDGVYQVTVGNLGSELALSVRVMITLDSNLIYQGSNRPDLSLPGEARLFRFLELPPFSRETFEIYFRPRPGLSPDQEFCSTAVIESETDCAPVSSARLEVTGSCDQETQTISFTVANVGISPTVGPVPFIIVEDEVILNESTLMLAADQTVVFPLENAENGTFHFSTLATPDSLSSTFAAATVSCAETPTIPRAAYPPTDLNSNVSVDCQPFSQLTDLREKTATPLGLTADRLVPQATTLTYRIALVNTLSSTLVAATLTDTLPALLDPLALTLGSSSHPVSWFVRNGVLRAVFPDMDLPPDSVAYLMFSVPLRPDVPEGSMVENVAWIALNGDPPQLTNTTFHMVGDLYEHLLPTEDLPGVSLSSLFVYPSPATDRLSVEVPEQLPRRGSYLVHDAHGRRLRTGRYQDHHFSLNTNGLRPGIYFCTSLSLSGRPTGRQRFVVQ